MSSRIADRELLITYLLHRMPESERLDFAERWFSDPDLTEQLSLAEAELFDAYVRGALPREQREGVEQHLLNSETQRRKLSFAAALRAVLEAPKPQRTPWFTLSAVAMVIVLIALAAWTSFQNRDLRNQIADLRQEARPAEALLYSATLTSTRRGAAPAVIRLPQGAGLLRLDLELGEGAPQASYAASVSIAGRSIWKQEPLAPENRAGALVVTLWISASVLNSGTYTIALESGGSPVAYYSAAIAR